MKINLLDPGLIHSGTHNYDWDLRIANYLVSLGHEVSLYAQAQTRPEAFAGFDKAVKLTRLFQMNPYIPASTYDPVSGELERQLMGFQSIVKDLSQVDQADLWFWPTACAYQLRACGALPGNAAISACLHIPPLNELDIPYAESGAWWRLAAKTLLNSGRRIQAIGPAEPEGRVLYLPYMGQLDLVPLPIPFDGNPRPRDELKTIGFFGARLRSEQGPNLMGALIDKCLGLGLKVFTQSETSVTDNPDLQSLGGDGDFAAKIERCDLIVAPYRWDTYVGRNSGIISQAIASGIPCVVPRGASFSRTLGASASFFSELSPQSIFDAILSAQKNYPALNAAALANAARWRNQNGLEKFVNVMIGYNPS